MLEARQSVRNLFRHPGFSIVTILTLALGIAANTLIFAVIDSVLIQPLPYPEADRLVRPYHQAPGLGLELDDLAFTDATYFHYRELGILEDLALYENGAVNLAGEAGPERVQVGIVSHSLFSVLRVPPLHGRTFVPADERPGAPRVVLLSEPLWRQRFGAEADALGETVLVDGVAHEVIGVMPAGLPFPDDETAMWLPMPLDPEQTTIGALGRNAVGRLAEGTSLAGTERRMADAVAALDEIFPIEQGSGVLKEAGFTTRIKTLKEHVVAGIGPALWLMMGSVAFVLLIACANVANLFLVRADSRERETAIRAALGADRRRIVAGFLTESVALGLAAGALGLALAAAGVSLLVALGPGNLPRLDEISIDGSALLVATAMSLGAGLLFGAIPALRFGSRWLAGALRSGGRAATIGRGRHRVRNLMVVSQVALALILLIGSGLMLRSFSRLTAVDPGFDPEGVLTFQLSLPAEEYPGEEAPARFVQELVDVLATMPGVSSAGAASDLPLSGQASGSGISIEDHPEDPGDLPKIHFVKRVTPGYFAAMGIAVVEGRALERADHEQRRPSALVNETFAHLYWPDGSALGRRIQPRSGEPDPEGWYTIVGVVEDVRNRMLEREPEALVYYPTVSLPGDRDRWESRLMGFAVRTEDDPQGLVAPVRARVEELDPNLPLAAVQPMSALLGRARARVQFTTVMLLIAACGALLIGAVGIYGVIGYIVSQQTREIGIRLAIGARAVEVGRMVLARSLATTSAGVIVGLLGALALSRTMESLLFGVSPLDPPTFVAVVVVLTLVAIVATVVPARRASSVDPMVALRHE